MKRFTLRLPDSLHNKLARLAKLEKRSIHAQILYILEKEITNVKSKST